MTSSKGKKTPRALSFPSNERAGVICDWLNVTCKPTDSFADALCDWLDKHGYFVLFGDKSSTSYRVGTGLLKISTMSNFHVASASGGVLSALREANLYRDYVNLLGSVGHKVTRLDAALDVAVDTPIVLSGLCRVYNKGLFSFGRKPLTVKRIIENRVSDNAESGTWYAGGHKSNARVVCRVYDKQLERASLGILTPPQTRYELTFKKDYGCSLWDAMYPKSIFYSHSSGLIDPPSDGYDVWDSRGLVPWVSDPVDTTLTVEAFRKRAMYSPDFIHLAKLASRFSSAGDEYLLSVFKSMLQEYRGDSGVPDKTSNDEKGVA